MNNLFFEFDKYSSPLTLTKDNKPSKNYLNTSFPIKKSDLMCNNTKLNQQNNDIYIRNIPDENMKILEDYRSNFNICDKQININTALHDKSYTNRITDFQFHKSYLEPGKGIGTTFLKNIDIDSNLKIHHNTNCITP